MSTSQCEDEYAGVIDFETNYCNPCPVGTGERVYFSEEGKQHCLYREQCPYTATDGKIAGNHCVSTCTSERPHLFNGT